MITLFIAAAFAADPLAIPVDSARAEVTAARAETWAARREDAAWPALPMQAAPGASVSIHVRDQREQVTTWVDGVVTSSQSQHQVRWVITSTDARGRVFQATSGSATPLWRDQDFWEGEAP
jgi:hypothetical protein